MILRLFNSKQKKNFIYPYFYCIFFNSNGVFSTQKAYKQIFAEYPNHLLGEKVKIKSSLVGRHHRYFKKKVS